MTRRTVQGCTGIPVVGQVPSRTVHGCTCIRGVGQLLSRTVQGVQIYQGRAVAEQKSTGLYSYTRGRAANSTEQYRAVPLYKG